MFKTRDLLLIAALVLGGVIVAYRAAIVSKARQTVPAVTYYVDAPQREADLKAQHAAEIAKLEAVLDDRSQQLWDAGTREGQLDLELHNQRRLAAAQAETIKQLDADLASARSEIAGLKTRYASLCQQLLELGNDVPSVLAGQ